MAFLDNSGDIILDAVLTDAGRQRMSKGNFSIVKFALGDDEINYELFNSSHPSGSAFNDLEIMQTPILEAFTNNTSTMKSKLLSISRTNILYMPVLKLNEKNKTPGFQNINHARVQSNASQNMFVVAVDRTTVTELTQAGGTLCQGVMIGPTGQPGDPIETMILIDQGKETNGAESIEDVLDSDLLETQYIVQMDHRLGRLASPSGQIQNFSFVDDDDIATYYFGVNEQGIVQNINYFAFSDESNRTTLLNDKANITPFNGPLGTNVRFRIKSSNLLQQSDLLFTEIGGGATTTTVRKELDSSNSSALKFIDSIVRVTGVTTGYSIDLPVRYVKK